MEGKEEVRTEACPEYDFVDHFESSVAIIDRCVGFGGICLSRFDRCRRYDVIVARNCLLSSR
jgi:hypothetical protein